MNVIVLADELRICHSHMHPASWSLGTRQIGFTSRVFKEREILYSGSRLCFFLLVRFLFLRMKKKKRNGHEKLRVKNQ